MTYSNTFDPSLNGYNEIIKESLKNEQPKNELLQEMVAGKSYQFSDGKFSFIVIANDENHASEILFNKSEDATNNKMKAQYRAASARQNGYNMQPLQSGMVITTKNPIF